MSQEKQLYGGALTALLPNDLLDVADLRQIPDTQEAFVARDSDVSYIFDVTQAVEFKDPAQAIKFHFEALAEDNAAASFDIASISPSSTSNGPSTLYGRQIIAKYRKGPEEADLVDIYLALWRIPSKNSDVVFTVNVPRGKANQVQPETISEPSREKQQFQTVVNSLKILDMNLFAG